MSFKDFIEHNRQKNSTTELVWAVIRADGYFVVSNHSTKASILKKYTALKADNVFTVYDLKKDGWKGREQRPVFIDAPCMATQDEDPLMGLSVKELLRRASAAPKQAEPAQATETAPDASE